MDMREEKGRNKEHEELLMKDIKEIAENYCTSYHKGTLMCL